MSAKNLFEAIVIGSGPGGALTAFELVNKGVETLLLEEGPRFSVNVPAPYSTEEMKMKYRCGGITPTFGKPRVSYVEGRCVGGGSEINSGLYHRVPDGYLTEWAHKYDIKDFSENCLNEHFSTIEKKLSVSLDSEHLPLASQKLHQGAQALGWKSIEVPRWFKRNGHDLERKSMSASYLPEAESRGLLALGETKVQSISRSGTCWNVSCTKRDKSEIEFKCKYLFLCAGAIQTPLILRRSRLSKIVGTSLNLHPTVKVVAEFSENVNSLNMGVPVHQVKEFSPTLSLGCSISTPPHIALAMVSYRDEKLLPERWKKMAIYYAMGTGGKGSIRPLPFFQDPLVNYHMTDGDIEHLRDGFRYLAKCLFAAGAKKIYPVMAGATPLVPLSDFNIKVSDMKNASIMTIHLMGSCKMGESKSLTATNSYGAVHDTPNLYVNDASLLGGSIGVNPQGTIMAIARRNILKFISDL